MTSWAAAATWLMAVLLALRAGARNHHPASLRAVDFGPSADSPGLSCYPKVSYHSKLWVDCNGGRLIRRIDLDSGRFELELPPLEEDDWGDPIIAFARRPDGVVAIATEHRVFIVRGNVFEQVKPLPLDRQVSFYLIGLAWRGDRLELVASGSIQHGCPGRVGDRRYDEKEAKEISKDRWPPAIYRWNGDSWQRRTVVAPDLGADCFVTLQSARLADGEWLLSFLRIPAVGERARVVQVQSVGNGKRVVQVRIVDTTEAGDVVNEQTVSASFVPLSATHSPEYLDQFGTGPKIYEKNPTSTEHWFLDQTNAGWLRERGWFKRVGPALGGRWVRTLSYRFADPVRMTGFYVLSDRNELAEIRQQGQAKGWEQGLFVGDRKLPDSYFSPFSEYVFPDGQGGYWNLLDDSHHPRLVRLRADGSTAPESPAKRLLAVITPGPRFTIWNRIALVVILVVPVLVALALLALRRRRYLPPLAKYYLVATVALTPAFWSALSHV